MVAIVVPVYNRKEAFRKALQSLTIQTNKKFMVLVVDDCSEEDIKSICDEFNDELNITYKRLEKNSGPGAAREYGLDIVKKSRVEYVMFMDADDLLFPQAIAVLNREIRSCNANIISSEISVEGDQGETQKIDENHRITWMHGKIYRVAFLRDNDIHFPTDVYNEDAGFNLLCYCLGCPDKKVINFNEPLYYWRNNPESITRSLDRNGLIKINSDYIYSMSWAIDQVKQRNGDLKHTFPSFLNIYNYYQSVKAMGGDMSIIDKVLKEKLPLREFGEFLKDVKFSSQHLNSLNNSYIHEKEIFLFEETFKDWIKRIGIVYD